ncbi:MAG: acyl-CoA synthetase, partial [Boseongicola sp. SB0667_bin_21]|nr:acyl-CoA synthetase [Boseongicola sp. SB0667_bin_21]
MTDGEVSMDFTSVEDRNAIEAEMGWEARDVPKSVYGVLAATAAAHGDGSAISYQLLAGPKDPAETLTWREQLDRTTQA